MDEELAREVRAAAERSGESLSGWMAEAADRRLKLEAMRFVLDDYEAEHGVIGEDELAAARERLAR